MMACLKCYLDSPTPHQLKKKRKKKNIVKVGPPLTTFSGSAHDASYNNNMFIIFKCINFFYLAILTKVLTTKISNEWWKNVTVGQAQRTIQHPCVHA